MGFGSGSNIVRNVRNRTAASLGHRIVRVINGFMVGVWGFGEVPRPVMEEREWGREEAVREK